MIFLVSCFDLKPLCKWIIKRYKWWLARFSLSLRQIKRTSVRQENTGLNCYGLSVHVIEHISKTQIPAATSGDRHRSNAARNFCPGCRDCRSELDLRAGLMLPDSVCTSSELLHPSISHPSLSTHIFWHDSSSANDWTISERRQDGWDGKV